MRLKGVFAMKRDPVSTECAAPIATAQGVFWARYSAQGLCGLEFPGDKPRAQPGSLPVFAKGWHELTTQAVSSAMAGKAPKRMPPLDLSSGSEFQRAVWAAMLRVPWGKTTTYGQLAREVKRPASARAVGGACGANPVPVLVPCHRVLAANRKLGGFSGGLDWKRKLLELEAK
jgi:O-6-methylguanine DNA methyltransferase